MNRVKQIKCAAWGLLLIIVNVLGAGCEKFLEVDAPSTRLTSENVFNGNATAASVLTGLYTNLNAGQFTTVSARIPALSRFAGLSADELTMWTGAINSGTAMNLMQVAYYTNALFSTQTDGYGAEFYGNFYTNIFGCNAIIDGLTNSTDLTPAVKDQLMGEARFMRALFYFYATNLYGDIPLPTSIDFTVNRMLPKSTQQKVYELIIEDLLQAQNVLSPQYLNAQLNAATTERVRPTRWAATALLSRVYLYTKQWANAEAQTTLLISNTGQYELLPLNSVFLKNSREAIWQLQPVNAGWNTEDARLFILPAAGFTNNNSVHLSAILLDQFETGDQRKEDGNWIKRRVIGADTIYYAFKYKSATQNAPVTEYLMMLRLAEQYLIRAEARAQQDNMSGAKDDLDKIRERAGLTPSDAVDKASLLTAILKERQVELFTELGHRWLDLKRTESVDAVMATVTPVKSNGNPWNTFQKLYPFSFNELELNKNLVQNPGY